MDYDSLMARNIIRFFGFIKASTKAYASSSCGDEQLASLMLRYEPPQQYVC